MKKILSIALVSLLACGALLAGCGGEKKADPKAAGDKTKVAFVYVSSAKDGGYSMAHELGRQYVEKNMPNVQASYIESVPEGADSERVITQLASQGNKVIFTTSFGYMDPTINVAKKYPDITFLHCSGFKTAPNVGNYFGRMYEARYVTGIVAGADIIAQHQNTPGPQQAAEERGKYGIGYNVDMSANAPKASLTSAIWNWGPYYEETIKQVNNGTWKSGAYWGSMKDKVVDIAPYGPAVSDETKKLADAAKADIIAGKQKVFTGPLYDQSGAEKVPAGTTLTDKELLSMDWFVKGVDGKIQN